MSQATDKYYPVDILCWVTADVFEGKALPQREATMLLAECLLKLTITIDTWVSDH
ncbi:hypothetical protein [Streptomyces sp. NPDC055400]